MSAAGPAFSWKLHYHIRWIPKPSLDWEPFDTYEDAETCAKELARPDETYVIEAVRGACERCSPLFEAKLRQGAGS